jgi:type IV pilus assembly protein PilE
MHGFTLIELMIAVAIVAIIAAVAFPAFNDSVRKGRRADALAAIAAVQQAQERWRGNNSTYAPLANTAASGSPPNGLGMPDTSASRHYTIAISDNTATGYTVTAVAQGSQASDSKCAKMSVQLLDGNLRYAACATCSTFTYATNNACFSR